MMRRLLALALLAALPAAAHADHVEVDDRTFPWGACERTCIPAIVQPRFEERPALPDDARVGGVVLGGDARAYPLDILVWHEIVNDVVDGQAVAVTYCPLCGSQLVFGREVQGRNLTFQTSGRLHMNDLVMLDDETRSLWPQLRGEAVSGPLHGARLGLVPSTLATWGEWRAAHPQSKVLARPVCSDWPHAVSGCSPSEGKPARDYGRDPYGPYSRDRRLGIAGHESPDILGLHPKAQVVGLALGNASKAWPVAAVVEQAVVLDDVGGQPVVLTAQGGTVRAWKREAGQDFTPLDGARMMDARGGVWSLATGRAEDGRALRQLPAVPTFWFAWVDFHPQTLLWGQEAAGAPPPVPRPRAAPGADGSSSLGMLGAAAALALLARRGRVG